MYILTVYTRFTFIL